MNFNEKILNIQNIIENNIQEFKDLKNEILSTWSDKLSNNEKSNIMKTISDLDSKINLIEIALSEDPYLELQNLLITSERFKNKMK